MNDTHNSTFNDETIKELEQLAEQLGIELDCLNTFIEGNNLYQTARKQDYNAIAIAFLKDERGYKSNDKTDGLINLLMDDGLFTTYATAMNFIENNYIGAYSSKEAYALEKLKPLLDTLPDIILANLSMAGVADDLLVNSVVYEHDGLIHVFEFKR